MSDIDPIEVLAARKAGPRSLRRLSTLIARSLARVWAAGRVEFMIVVGLQLVAAGALAVQIFAVERVLTVILEVAENPGELTRLWLPVGVLAGMTAVTNVTGALQQNIERLLAEKVTAGMWHDVLGTSTRVSLRHFEDPVFFDRLQRVETNAVFRPYQVTQGLIVMMGAVFASLGLGVALVSLHPALLPLLLLGGAPLVITSRRESRMEFDFAVRQTPAERLREYIIELQTGRQEAAEIRAFALARELRRRLDALYATYLTDLKQHIKRRSLLNAFGNLGAAVALALTLVVLVWLVAQGGVTVAAAGAAIVAIRMLASQVQSLTNGIRLVFESGLFLDDIEAFLRMDLGTTDDDTELVDPPPTFELLGTDDVQFTYPGSDTPALDGVSISVRAGEVVALVGENGSGKTTLAKVVAGLYQPDDGAVRWDGVDARKYRPAGLRDRVTVIFQDFVRYALSATDNITIGRPDDPVQPDRVTESATAAGIDRALAGLPQGYATVLSRMFGGRDLSGGQWQRVALARALYRDAPLVILDEPTASMDARAEHDLFASLRTVLAGRSALVVSHRFSTVRTADHIYVLGAGRVVEHGTHAELMSQGGLYADLFRLQASAYFPDETD